MESLPGRRPYPRSSLNKVGKDPRCDRGPAQIATQDTLEARRELGGEAGNQNASSDPASGERAPDAAKAKTPSKKNEPIDSRGRRGGAAVPLPLALASPGPEEAAAIRSSKHKGFRRDYRIGDVLRSSADVLAHPTEAQAFEAASALNNHDFAFVKRSDGSFTYAILAYRSMERVYKGAKQPSVECMTFVMSGEGATKKVARCYWGDHVRLAAAEVAPPEDLPPIALLSFVPHMDDEECSAISSVSDRVRARRRM